jgi:hypothetical protein
MSPIIRRTNHSSHQSFATPPMQPAPWRFGTDHWGTAQPIRDAEGWDEPCALRDHQKNPSKKVVVGAGRLTHALICICT